MVSRKRSLRRLYNLERDAARTDVCQFWGDFLYVAREGREQRKARQGYWNVGDSSAALTR